VNNSDIIKQYVDTGIRLPQRQINRISPNLMNTYLRKRIIAQNDMSGWNEIRPYELEKMNSAQTKTYLDIMVGHAVESPESFLAPLSFDISLLDKEQLDKLAKSGYKLGEEYLDKLDDETLQTNLSNRIGWCQNNVKSALTEEEFDRMSDETFDKTFHGGITDLAYDRLKNYTISVDHEVDFKKLTDLPPGVKFNNNGHVKLSGISEIPEGTEFNNVGSVVLNNIKELPNDFRFDNKGWIYLTHLVNLPPTVIFNNNNRVIINPNMELTPYNLASLKKINDTKRAYGFLDDDTVKRIASLTRKKHSWE